jgi:hypothetical protein
MQFFCVGLALVGMKRDLLTSQLLRPMLTLLALLLLLLLLLPTAHPLHQFCFRSAHPVGHVAR